MSSRFFSKNMEALQKLHPDLATDIQKANPSKYTIKKRQTKGGFFLDLCIDGTCYMWQHTIVESIPSKKGLLFLGAGNGHVCLQYLKKHPSLKIVIWDCEIERLRLFLQFCDISTYIEQNRLKIIFGVELFSFQGLYHKKQIVTYTLPMLKELAQGVHFLKLFQKQQWKENLFLIGEGGLYVEDLCSYIDKRGDLSLIMSMRLWQLKYILKWKPKCLFTINFIPGLEHFCEENKLPYACWEIDPNMDPMERYPMQTRSYKYSKMFTYRKKHIPLYERLGIQSQYLPLAAPVYRQEASLVDPTYKQNLVFVGSSMNKEGQKSISKLHSMLKTKMSPADTKSFITRAIIHQKKHPDTYVIDDFFATHLSPHKIWFPKENLPILLGEYCASLRRLEYCTMVAKWGLDIWGDSGWEEIKDSGARIRGKVGYFKNINFVYSNGGIHLDINRLYQKDMITLRVFEVLACGGFILAEYPEALAELFDIGTEIETWRTKDELLDKISFYIDKPNLRDTIRRKGQSIVHQRHMFAQKMNYIMENMPPLSSTS